MVQTLQYLAPQLLAVEVAEVEAGFFLPLVVLAVELVLLTLLRLIPVRLVPRAKDMLVVRLLQERVPVEVVLVVLVLMQYL